ncbi:MAG: DUF4199 family protein [Chitinophagaceae bacterium]
MNKKYSIGIIYGIAGALIYSILLYLRYTRFARNPETFGVFATFSYFAILVFFFFAARARKMQTGGIATFREIFQSLLLTILITECGYAIFNMVYLHRINPLFFEQFRENTRLMLTKAGVEKEKIDVQLSGFDNMTVQYTIANILKGLGMWMLIDCIFGVLYASVLKKSK